MGVDFFSEQLMRIFPAFGIVLVAALVRVPAAARTDSGVMGLSPADDCFVMKQKVLAVSDARVAVVDNPGPQAALIMNRSGSTARSKDAAANVMAGDSACENNDLALARAHYQKALDDLMAED